MKLIYTGLLSYRCSDPVIVACDHDDTFNTNGLQGEI